MQEPSTVQERHNLASRAGQVYDLFQAVEPRYERCVEHLEGGDERDPRRGSPRVPSKDHRPSQWGFVGSAPTIDAMKLRVEKIQKHRRNVRKLVQSTYISLVYTDRRPCISSLQGMVTLPLCKYWGPLLQEWDALHIERHRKYSIERLYRYQVYCERTTFVRTLAVLALTPVSCLAIAALADLLLLEPLERGVAHSHLFWVRLLLVSWLILFAVIKQCCHFIVLLAMGLAEIIVASFFVAAGATASVLYISVKVGHPLPFTTELESPAAFVLLVAAMLGLWGKYLRRSRALQHELGNYVLVIMTQLTFTYMHPAYNFVFRKLDPLQQVAFTLLLPMFKIIVKNWMSFLLQDLEDLKPEFIIFNIEVFHALFVSSCM